MCGLDLRPRPAVDRTLTPHTRRVTVLRVDEFRALLAPHLAVRGGLARLSESSGVAAHLISRWASPDLRKQIRPSPDNLRRIAPALGVSYDQLLRMVYLSEQDRARTVDRRLAAVNAAWTWLPEGLRDAIDILARSGSRVSDHSTPSYRLANGVSGSPPAFSDASRDAAEGTSGNPEDGALSGCKPALERSLTLPTVARPQFSPA